MAPSRKKRHEALTEEEIARRLSRLGLRPEADSAALAGGVGHDPETDIAIVDRLARLGDRTAVEALLRVARTSPHKAVRRRAARELYRLRQRGVPVPEPERPAPNPPVPQPPVREVFAMLSAPDWEGGRMFWFDRPVRTGAVLLLGTLRDRGLLPDAAVREMSRKQVRSLRRKLMREGPVPAAPFDSAYVDFLVFTTHERGRAASEGPSQPDYPMLRRAVFGEASPPQAVDSPGKSLVPETGAAERPLLEADLSNQPWWIRDVPWWGPPPPVWTACAERIAAVVDSPIVVSELARQERIAALVDAIVEEWFGGEHRPDRARQLFDLAWVLHATGKEESARRAAAAGRALESGRDPRSIPFCRDFVRSLLPLEPEHRSGAPVSPPARTPAGILLPSPSAPDPEK